MIALALALAAAPPAPATLTRDAASAFARIALANVAREYPNKTGHVLAGPGDASAPRALHPAFYGSYDWHSCVHGHWLLVKALRAHPDLPEAKAVRAVLDAHLTPANVAAEVAYFARADAKSFERPYGWAWLLKTGGRAARLGRPRREALGGGAAAPRGRGRGELPRLLPEADLPDAGRHARQHRVRAGLRPRLRARGGRPGVARPDRVAGAGVLRGGRGLPGRVGAGRGGLPVAGAGRGRPDAPGAAAGRVPGVVRALPAGRGPAPSRRRCSCPRP